MITSNYQVDGDIYSYADKFFCDSQDDKPSNADAKDGLINGAILKETDTGKTYIFDKTADTWTEKPVNGGGSDITIESKTINANGTYTAPSGKAYSPVTVNVPNSYAAGDEGKVVSNGELVAQTSDTVTQNGTVDTTLINSLTVNVSGGGVTVEPLPVSSNGTYTAPSGKAYSPVAVELPGPAWTEFIATADETNIAGVFNMMFGNASYGHFYIAVLDKKKADYVNNQVVQLAVYSTNGTANNSQIAYMRYKDNGYNAVSGHTTSFDAVVKAGDKFYICEV